MNKGVDVSVWQGSVDWGRVAAAGYGFAMVRGGFSLTVDKLFREHMEGAAGAGLDLGVYWFSYALDEREARAEAETCLEAAKGYPVVYPIAFDYEYDSAVYSAKKGVPASKEHVTALAAAFCGELRKAGRLPMIYGNEDCLDRYIDPDAADAELWLADWGDKDEPSRTAARPCAIWQYAVAGSEAELSRGEVTAKGSVPGINGPVALNICFEDYKSRAAASEGQRRAEGRAPARKDGADEAPGRQDGRDPDGFSPGERVLFSGGTQYSSPAAKYGLAAKPCAAVVLDVAPGRKNPVNIRAADSKGRFAPGVFGWVEAETLRRE